ncbi:hypothetical protein CWB92_19415 [Pseudoalteromonas piscicida]|nr:hypothetical protein CWB92_19415 [Pseudoalteromonas piscicida]
MGPVRWEQIGSAMFYVEIAHKAAPISGASAVGADWLRDVLCRDRRVKRLPPAGDFVWWERIGSGMFFDAYAAKAADPLR